MFFRIFFSFSFRDSRGCLNAVNLGFGCKMKQVQISNGPLIVTTQTRKLFVLQFEKRS